MIPQSKPLSGLVVADFTRVLSGPTATMILSDLGADVIKVERPGTGDVTREWGPPFRGTTSTYYLSANRGKRSFAVDLGTSEGLEAARKLITRADIVMENFRPGTMTKLGLGYDLAKGLNPAVIYCSISGFGTRGRAASLPGYDFIAQAVGGLMSITGEADGEPMKVGVALVDILVGHHALIGILAALRRRELTGEGVNIEVNLLSSLLSSLANQGSAYVAAGQVPVRRGNAHPSIAPYELLYTSDGTVAVAVGTDKQFSALCAAIERPDLTDDTRFASNALRVANREALVAELEPSMTEFDTEAVLAMLAEVQVPSGKVNTIAEAFELADELGLEPVQKLRGDGRIPQVSPPFRFGGDVPQIEREAPGLGQHSADVQAWLDMLEVSNQLR